MSYEEEDTCMSYEEEDTRGAFNVVKLKLSSCMSYEEEDTCMSYEEEDTCMSYEFSHEVVHHLFAGHRHSACHARLGIYLRHTLGTH
jgi:hypothetical protein